MYSYASTVTGSTTKLKTGSNRLCEQLRTLNVSQMTNSMHASDVPAVFGLPLPVLHFVTDPRTLVRLCINRINFTELNFQFFQ